MLRLREEVGNHGNTMTLFNKSPFNTRNVLNVPLPYPVMLGGQYVKYTDHTSQAGSTMANHSSIPSLAHNPSSHCHTVAEQITEPNFFILPPPQHGPYPSQSLDYSIPQ